MGKVFWFFFSKKNCFLALPCLLTACGLGPAYVRPNLDVPTAYRASPHSAHDIWPDKDWWKGFGSPDLNALIAEAKIANFDIQAAVARVKQADAQLGVTGAPLLPALTGNADQTWTHESYRNASLSLPRNNTYKEGREYQLNAGISYELDLWGRLRAQQESAAASALYSRFDQETVALTVVTSVATTWFNALADQDRLAVLARNIHDAQSILSAIQARRDAGTVSQLDVRQQATLVAGLLTQLPPLRSDLEQQLNGLGILTGHPPESVTAKPGTLTNLSLPELEPGLPLQILERRPDVQAAEANLVAANANLKVARANFFPQISLTGSGGWQSAAFTTLTGPGGVVGTVATSLVQPLFDNGKLTNQFAQTTAQREELVAKYRKAVVQAFTDVDNAMVAYRYATEQEKLERQAVDTAQGAADVARAQLLGGTIDLVAALQAQNALYTDEDLLVQARLARFQALLSLYKAMGGGWQRSDVSAPVGTVFNGIL
jgi:NodT family efflux transporter outer membrane factor (OMF) lipoprotein